MVTDTPDNRCYDYSISSPSSLPMVRKSAEVELLFPRFYIHGCVHLLFSFHFHGHLKPLTWMLLWFVQAIHATRPCETVGRSAYGGSGWMCIQGTWFPWPWCQPPVNTSYPVHTHTHTPSTGTTVHCTNIPTPFSIKPTPSPCLSCSLPHLFASSIHSGQLWEDLSNQYVNRWLLSGWTPTHRPPLRANNPAVFTRRGSGLFLEVSDIKYPQS